MGMEFIYWFLRATTAQKISVMICFIIFAAGAIIGIYQLTGGEIKKPNLISGADETKVMVQAIEDSKYGADILANTPAETVTNPTAGATDSVPAQVVSNTVTVETPPQDYYIAEDGAHYESAPAYEEPAASEPVYEAPAADSESGWDGNLHSTPAVLTDDVGEYANGISN